jgi:hypothetical protein
MMEPSLPCSTRSGVRRRLAAFLMAGLLASGLSPLSAQAQNLPLPEQSYVNEFARPGEPTITLYLWGAVGNTGIWRVERNIDLIELLSVAGIPGLGAPEQEVRQTFLLQIYRGNASERTLVFEEKIESLIGGRPGDIPSLRDGDIVAIKTETRRRLGLQFWLEALRTTTSLLSLYLLLRSEF